MIFKVVNPWLALLAALVGSFVTLIILFVDAWSESTSLPDEVVTVQHIIDDIGVKSLSRMTHLQAQEADTKWRGKRLMVSGKIESVQFDNSPNSVLSSLNVHITSQTNYHSIGVAFNPKPWIETMKRMNKGDVLSVRGEIAKIYINGSMSLNKGEVVSHKRPWRFPFFS